MAVISRIVVGAALAVAATFGVVAAAGSGQDGASPVHVAGDGDSVRITDDVTQSAGDVGIQNRDF
ncbi:hypothetical protein [Cryptosporangium minutisporangium]|uniref:hypothetical protein n=1 Tax=Cryptosporangium minutisporangium TaxID=113569 RepID=UPI0035EC145E